MSKLKSGFSRDDLILAVEKFLWDQVLAFPAQIHYQKNSPANFIIKHTEKYYYAFIIIMVPSLHYSVPPAFLVANAILNFATPYILIAA